MTKEHYLEGHPLYVPWEKLTEAVQLIDPSGENHASYLWYLHYGVDDLNLPFVLSEAQKLAASVIKTTPRRTIASLGITPEALRFRILVDINHLTTRLEHFSKEEIASMKQFLGETLCSQLDQVLARKQQSQS